MPDAALRSAAAAASLKGAARPLKAKLSVMLAAAASWICRGQWREK
jgi:hypothetical protein